MTHKTQKPFMPNWKQQTTNLYENKFHPKSCSFGKNSLVLKRSNLERDFSKPKTFMEMKVVLFDQMENNLEGLSVIFENTPFSSTVSKRGLVPSGLGKGFPQQKTEKKTNA